MTTLHRANSQHIRRLAWCSARLDAVHLMGSTSQFSSDSYRARMNSPGVGAQQRVVTLAKGKEGGCLGWGISESHGWRLESGDSRLGSIKLRKGDLGSGVARFRVGMHIW